AVYPGAALSVYLQSCDCPTVGQSGQAGPAAIQYLLPGTSSCTPAPTPFTNPAQVYSDCPSRIHVDLLGGSGTYRVTFRRLLPSVTAPVSYNVTGTVFNYTVLNTPLPQVWEVFAQSVCAGPVYSVMTPIVTVQVKGGCNKIQNLLLSHVTCHGLYATWNVGDCGVPSTNLLGYTVFVKPGASQWSGYPSLTNIKSFSIFNSGTVIQVYVRANSCNGSFGPASDIVTTTTLSVGCRDEEQGTEENLLSGGVVTDNGTLSLFPNPTPGQFNIDLQTVDLTTKEVRIEVMNMLGQTVLTQITSISGGHLTENVGMPSSISSGTYMVKVIVGDKATFNTRVNISK
ncbi:MAG: T9SS type A sorting domain-containing protein, partial [Bacteroidota bacterium]